MTRESTPPTRERLAKARGETVPDLIRPALSVLFCGINPSLYSAAVGHHFARPGNRFWRTLHGAGFTPRLFAPTEERLLLDVGVGITNVVARATASADELSAGDYAQGARELRRKLTRYRPRVIAFLGIGAYRLVAESPAAMVGPQATRFAGSEVWALPNPSGLNAHYSLAALVQAYAALFEAALCRGALAPSLSRH